MSIVQLDKIKNDPQKLLYMFPNMNAVRYHKLQEEFSFWKSVKTAEEIAGIFGLLLVPRNCIHWQRKLEIEEKRRIVIKKRVFYLLAESEMTENEKRKYHDFNKLFPDFVSLKK